MKKITRLFSVVLPLFIVAQNVAAQNDNDNKNDNQKKYEFVKTKSVNKSYNVSSSDKLKVDNLFGSVEIHTWNKNEIKVDISIEVSANVEATAQKLIDGITISDSKSGGDINFKTSIKGTDKDDNHNKNEKTTMKINYDISMPASNPLQVSNQFGKTVVPDFKGDIELTSKFGSLTTGTLSNTRSVNVEFGSAKIESVNGPVSIKYSSAEIAKLVGNIKMNVEFSTVSKINIDNSLTGLDAKVSYSTVNFKPSGSLSASYEISTSFGSFKNRTDIKFDGGDDDKDDHGPKFDHNYNGKAGSGSVPVKIRSSFGKVILGEPNADDMKDKEKNRSRSKTT
jgi:hypothetical protein